MASNAEKELVEIFEKAEKLAGKASREEYRETDEQRCVDALKALPAFPVNRQFLLDTQLGKRLRTLTKHPRERIRAAASKLLDSWKKVVASELSAESNSKGPPKFSSTDKFHTKLEERHVKSDKEENKRKLELSEERKGKSVTVKEEKKRRLESSEEKKGKYVAVKDSGDNELKKPKLESSSQSNLNAPSKLPSTAKCNDQWRDKVRENLLEVFSRVVHEVQGEELESVRGFDPVQVAVAVETVMFNKLGSSDGDQKVKAKYRSILFNMKADKNPDLRRRVLTGEIEAGRLMVMTSEEMASDARKFENSLIKDKALFHCERGMKKMATTTEFKCGRCGKRETTYYQMQTRSADEPMTTYVTCINCNNHWKFC